VDHDALIVKDGLTHYPQRPARHVLYVAAMVSSASSYWHRPAVCPLTPSADARSRASPP
jgi:hypothetical protein